MDDNQSIILKELRAKTNTTQRQMSAKLGIPLRTWEDWESGRRKMPVYLLRLINYKIRNIYSNEFQEEIRDKKVSIIQDCDGNRIVLINDVRFKGRRNINWNTIEQYLKEYIGEYEEIVNTSDLIYIDSDFPDEFTHSKDTKTLRGGNAYAKANSSLAIKEMISIANNKSFGENLAKKHNKDAKYGWYRYDTRFAIPKYNDINEMTGYNIYKARLIVRHSEDDKLYLYDIIRIKKETSRPLEQ